MQLKCLRCKGRGFCGRIVCPMVAKASALFRISEQIKLKENFSGDAPAPFVGRIGYPFVNVGVLALQEQREDAWLFDAPRYWAMKDYSIDRIMVYRSSLVNSRTNLHVGSVKSDKSRLVELEQEIALAEKPVDVEVWLKKKPVFRLNFNAVTMPSGPVARLKKAKLIENPFVPRKIEKAYADYDLKAEEAVFYLYESGFDENKLAKALSVGCFGVKTQRKLVPTRWSITAVDDIIARRLIKIIRDFNFQDYVLFFDGYLGNYYMILFFPSVWRYELFEIYAPKVSWNQSNQLQYTTDYEGNFGRKTYAENCAGGYYTVRLAILEKLRSVKRQASVLALRFITGEYYVPLGVWVTREAARKSLQGKGICFSSMELMLKYAADFAQKKFRVDLNKIFEQSKLLKELKEQKRIADF